MEAPYFIPVGLKLPFEEKDFAGSTLIVPTMSVGNVPQLTVDLMIQTWSAERIGFLDDSSVVRIIGNLPYDLHGSRTSSLLSLSLEVYHVKSKNIFLLQQRAPVMKNKNGQFAQNLSEWIKKSAFSRVILIHASMSSYRIDAQLQGVQIRQYNVSNEATPVEYTFPILEKEFHPKPAPGDDNFVYSKGSFLRKFSASCKDNAIPLATLITFCAEGENIPDSMNLATWTNTVLSGPSHGSEQINWKQPSCWEWLHGPSFSEEIF